MTLSLHRAALAAAILAGACQAAPAASTPRSARSAASSAPAAEAARKFVVQPGDREVARWFTEEPLCLAMYFALSCSDGRVLRIDTAVNPMTGPTQCEAWCADRQNERDGDYRRTLIGITRAGEQVRGQYRRGVPVGRWMTTVLGHCGPRAADACPARVIGDEHYDEQGRIDGQLRRWYPNGKPSLRETYRKGRRVGDFMSWHEDGRPWIKGSFALGEPQYDEALVWIVGTQLAAPSGAPPRSADSSGIPVGAWIWWYTNGNVALQRHFDARGRPTGKHCNFHVSGEPFACHELVDGTGTLVIYDDEQNVVERRHYQAGRLDGVVERYEEGKLVGRFEYRHDRLDGVARIWDHDGHLLEETSYREGLMRGAFRDETWNDDGGREIETGRYCDDEKPCGVWTRHSTTEQWREEKRYDDDGNLIGERHWDETGQLTEFWSAAQDRQLERAACLRELARGGCCAPEQHPPKGARLCD